MSASTSHAVPSNLKYLILILIGFVLSLTLMVKYRNIAVFTTHVNHEGNQKSTSSIEYNNDNTDQQSCTDCGYKTRGTKDYTTIFGDYKFPEPDCNGKLFVYECRHWLCGGLADREKGIISTFLLAMLTNRTFVIDHSKPCDIKQFLFPNKYDWSKCMPSVAKARLKGNRIINYIDALGQFPSDFSGHASGDLWSQHVVTMHVNVMLQKRIQSHPDAPKKLPWLLDLPPENVITGLLHVLFKHEESLARHAQSFLSNNTRNGSQIFVAVHIRADFLKADRDIPIIFKYLQQFSDTEKYTLYIATDKIEVRNQAMRTFPNLVSINRTIVHVDQYGKPCDGLYTAVLEQYLLSRADILIMTHSGFSRLAAYLRGTDKGIYIYEWNEDKHDGIYKQSNLSDILSIQKPI